MSARGAVQMGSSSRSSHHGEPTSWYGNTQPKIPFGSALKKPVVLFTDGDLELQANAGKSVERLGASQRCQNNRPNSGLRGTKILTTAILTDKFVGKLFDKRGNFSEEVTVERGSLLRSMSIIDDVEVLTKLKNSYRDEKAIKEPLFMKCLEVDDVYLRVPSSKILLISEYEAKLLLGVHDYEVRYDFYSDSDLFSFVEQLSKGSRVRVQVIKSVNGNPCAEDSARCEPGQVSWIGEITQGRGIFFGILLEKAVGNMDGVYRGRRLFTAPRNGAVLVSGDMIRKPYSISSASVSQSSALYIPTAAEHYSDSSHPSYSSASSSMRRSESLISGTESTSRGSVVRHVPITMVSSSRHDRTVGRVRSSPNKESYFDERFSSSAHRPLQSSSAYSLRRDATDISSHELSSAARSGTAGLSLDSPLMESASVDLIEYCRSKQPCSGETTKTLQNGTNCALADGDRIVWFDAVGLPRRGTVRWTGKLRGHTNLYVGVDFDEAIGRGTGRFEGVEVFRAPLNHAGFLPISACMRESDMVLQKVGPSEHETTHKMPLTKEKPASDKETNAEGSQSFSDSLNALLEKKSEESGGSSSPFIIGSCVEVDYRNERRFGVVKWIGYAFSDERSTNSKSAAVEIEGALPHEWPSAMEERMNVNVDEIGRCSGAVALVPLVALRCDNRFATSVTDENSPMNIDSEGTPTKGLSFGNVDSGVELHPCAPTRSIENLVGRMKGIQGFRNSCYLDATLYAMFVQSTAFDSLLNMKEAAVKGKLCGELVRILATEIVYPLRRFHFVRADHVLRLRQLLERLLPEMPGLTTDEKDPEELLTAVFSKILKIDPFLTMRNVADGKIDAAYICPLITEDLWSSEQRHLISVQSLVERSLFASNIQFAKDPKTLILQIPRYGQQKVFDKIIPQQELNITHLVYGAKRPCCTCSKPADLICPECFLTKEDLLGEVTYCKVCYEKAHLELDHRPQTVRTDVHSLPHLHSLSRKVHVPQRKLQLSAVLCIETSHYVAFVRSPSANKWVMLDSMADRVGLDNGYNVPQVKQCDKIASWLSESGLSKLRTHFAKEHRLPAEVESDAKLMRLLSDCYVCFYTSEEFKSETAVGIASRFFA